MENAENAENAEKRNYFQTFWEYIKPYRKPLRIVYILYFANSLLNLLPAFIIRYYIDIVLIGEKTRLFGFPLPSLPADVGIETKVYLSIYFLVGAVLLIIGANAIGVVMWRLGTKNIERFLFDLKVRLHNHINKLSLGYLYSERVGTIMTKSVNDVNNVSILLRQSFNLVYLFVQLLLAPVLMISLSWHLFLVVLIPLPIALYAMYSIKYKLKPMYKTQRENESKINSQIQEVISGVKEIKAFNMEGRSEKEYSDINEKFYETQNRIMRVFSTNHQLQYGSKDFALILIAVGGGLFMFHGIGGITVGMIMSFMPLSNFLFSPISGFVGFFDVLQRGMVSLERIIDFLGVAPDVKDRPNAKRLSNVKGAVTYESVSFSYDENEPVLKDISFTVKAGEKIAIVGPSGSGKSTLLSLLPRFYDTRKGRIFIDDRNITEYTQVSIRANIGIVFQETFLFYGSIRDNLMFANPSKTEEDMVAACRAANIYDTIAAFPQGFDTLVGERGVRLSGGQKQRLAIARVFLKDPAIVILDEATSAVDTVTEAQIQESIDHMLEHRTAFIIAHRLSTIKKCDKIIVLGDHTVQEIGAHSTLMKKKGRYYELQQQSKK